MRTEEAIRKRIKELKKEIRQHTKEHPTYLINWQSVVNSPTIEALEWVLDKK